MCYNLYDKVEWQRLSNNYFKKSKLDLIVHWLCDKWVCTEQIIIGNFVTVIDKIDRKSPQE